MNKTYSTRIVSFISFFIFTLSFQGFSQHSIDFTIGVGGTVVDIETLVEEDEIDRSYATDWGLLNYGVGGQFTFATKGAFGFGAELMYQQMYWYSVRVPYGTQYIYRDYSVSAFKITPIIRIGANNHFNVDLGPEFNFMDGLQMGLLVSVNYYIPVSERIEIPIKVRFDVINDIVITVPISLNAGVRVNL